MNEILLCTDVNDATKLLVDKISQVLDEMAPIKTIQTRTNYVPWLSEDTKGLPKERDDVQKKASQNIKKLYSFEGYDYFKVINDK
mgnify:CR=1 FL=1